MALVRALENRRKMEEKEKKRLEARAERIATKEKRAEQRRVEMELIEQIRKPVEDMELTGTRTKERSILGEGCNEEDCYVTSSTLFAHCRLTRV